MAIYRARAPFVSAKQKRLFILKLIFPLTALWLGLKFVFNFFFGRLLGKVILRPQSMADIGADLIADVTKFNSDTLTCSAEKIITHDSCELDTIEIKHRAQEHLPPRDQKYVIYFTGRWQCYERAIEKITDTANDLQTNIVAFNYRGVGKSTGCAYRIKDLVTDGIAQVQRLLDQGIDPEFIVLRGYSLGGAVATKIAEHFHAQSIMLNVFNERSFSNVMHVIAGFLRHIGAPEKSGHKSGVLGIFLSVILWPFLKLTLLLIDWEMEAADAFRKIPRAHREYIAVRSSKQQIKEDNKIIDDCGITHFASLHRALKDERQIEKNEINAARVHIKKVITSNPLVNSELQKADECFEKSLNYLKSRKMVTNPNKPEDKYQNAHYLDLKDLISRATNQSGSMFFKNFVKKTQELHEKVLQAEQLDAEVVGASPH